jgi:biotin carboxylase
MTGTAAPDRLPHVLVVGGGREIPGRLRERGARVTFLCRLGVVESIIDPRAAAGIHGLPPAAPTADWVALARFLHQRDGFTAVASFSEKDQDKAAEVAVALGLPWHSPETVRLVHDKSAMRGRLVEAGVDDTTNAVVRSTADVVGFGERHGWPVVVKPASGTGSSGVTIVTDAGKVAEAWDWVTAARLAENDTILVEQYLTGDQYSVETYSEDGAHVPVAIVEQHVQPPHCVNVAYVTPAPLAARTAERIRSTVGEALAALGIRDGVTNTEIMLGGDGVPRVIEVNLRPAGDDTPELVLDGLGVDLIDLLVRRTLGERVIDELRGMLGRPGGAGAAAICFTSPDRIGRVVEIAGLDEASREPGVVAVRPLLAVGDMTEQVLDAFSRGAVVRCSGQDARETLRAARSAAKRIRIVTDRHDAPVEAAL